MLLRDLGPADADLLSPLVRSYGFAPFRHYRTYSPEVQTAVLAAEIEPALSHPGGAVYLDGSGEARAAVIVRRLQWDSEFFGVPMARIEYVLGEDAGAREAVVRSSLEVLREAGTRHVSAHVDAGDLATIALLQSRSFRLMGGRLTYIARPATVPKPARGLGRIRPLEEADEPQVIAITEEAFRGFRSRFHVDPRIPRDRADAFYPEWARQAVSGRTPYTGFVSEGREGRLMGFLAFRAREPVSAVSGVPVFGAALGACRPEAPGAYLGLVQAGNVWIRERGGVTEAQTQTHNHATVRIYEAAGLRFARAEHTLHAWLGPE